MCAFLIIEFAPFTTHLHLLRSSAVFSKLYHFQRVGYAGGLHSVHWRNASSKFKFMLDLLEDLSKYKIESALSSRRPRCNELIQTFLNHNFNSDPSGYILWVSNLTSKSSAERIGNIFLFWWTINEIQFGLSYYWTMGCGLPPKIDFFVS